MSGPASFIGSGSGAMSLPELQNLIKRDPDGYKEEFLMQLRHFESQLEVFRLRPDSGTARTFGELCTFMAQVSYCYPAEMGDFPQRVAALLESGAQSMPPPLRMSLVRALILMRNRNQVTPTALLTLFFTLFRVRDKQLRTVLHGHIVSDVKGINSSGAAGKGSAAALAGGRNKVNSEVQNFMYTMLRDTGSIAAKKSLDVIIELYRRGVWTDAKTVNVIASACLSDEPRLIVACLKFFLGVDDEDAARDQDDGEEGGELDAKALWELQHSVRTKLTKKKRKHAQRVLEKAIKGASKKKQGGSGSGRDFSALHLIHDPQGFAEKLFSRLKRSTGGFEVRVMAMTLISRLIGIHQLLLLNFYPYVQRYIKPHQENVTVILSILAQACHELVPPETLEPIVRHLADEFVSDRSSDEARAVGLNTIREVCARVPLCMSPDLLHELVDLKGSRSKQVSSSARGLLALFREIDPGMLRKKDRGKGASLALADAGVRNKNTRGGRSGGGDDGDDAEGAAADPSVRPARYGEQRAETSIEGIELLVDYEREKRIKEIVRDRRRKKKEAFEREVLGLDGDVDDDESEDEEDEEDEDEEDEEDEDDNSVEGEDGDEKSAGAGEGSVAGGSDEGKDDDDDDDGWELADADGDDSSGWIDVSDDEDDEDVVARAARKDGEEDEGEPPVDPSEIDEEVLREADRAAQAVRDRILTPADFERLKVLKAKKRLDAALGTAKTKRQRERIEMEFEDQSGDTLASLRDGSEKVNPEALVGSRKKARMDHAERLAHIREGREERMRFGSKFGKSEKMGGKSNKEALRNKPYQLVKHSARISSKSAKLSFRDKQVRTQKHKANAWRQKNKSGGRS